MKNSNEITNLFKQKEYIKALNLIDSKTHNEFCKIYLEDDFKEIIRSSYSFSNIINAYEKREYHNLSHLAYCINMLDITKSNIKRDDYKALKGAIFFHDFIMERNKDEERSANYAYEVFKSHSDINPNKIHSLIMATQHSSSQNLSGDEAIIHDIDLAILGDGKNYKVYSQNIRLEYKDIDDKTYTIGRTEFLKSMLGKDKIFTLPFFQDTLEEQAKTNINQEIDNIKDTNNRINFIGRMFCKRDGAAEKN